MRQRAVDEGVADPGCRPQHHPGQRGAVDAGPRSEEQPADQRCPRRDVVQADGRHQLPPGRVHVVDEDQFEDQSGDDDAQQRIQSQHPPHPAVPVRVDRQGDGDDQHQDVALDGEEADGLHHAGPDPDTGHRFPGVRVRTAGQHQHQHQLDHQGDRPVDGNAQVPPPGRPPLSRTGKGEEGVGASTWIRCRRGSRHLCSQETGPRTERVPLISTVRPVPSLSRPGTAGHGSTFPERTRVDETVIKRI